MRNIILASFILVLTLAARDFYEIKKSGELNVGIRVRNGVLSEDKNSGFHYDLIKAFCTEHGLKCNLVVKKDVNDYFSEKAFEDCDMIADNLTITPERSAVVKFIPVLPTKQILVTSPSRKPGDKLRGISRETIVVKKESTYHKNMLVMQANAIGQKYKFFFSDVHGDQYDDLVAGKGTVTVLDANLAVLRISDVKQIRYKTIVSDLEIVGWATSRTTPAVHFKLKYFIEEVKASGYFAQIWSKYSAIVSYGDYLNTISVTEHKTEFPFQGGIQKLIDTAVTQ